MDNPIIEEKLKVFVSSAMGEEVDSSSEETVNWLEFRKRVKVALNKCDYINAFTIEDRASTMKSNDFMKANIDFSDVVVLLIKNDFRKGTMVEYTHCRETNKPLLVFFFGNTAANSEANSLRQSLIDNDYCTFISLPDFANAENVIANAVIQDVIFYYRFKNHTSSSHPIDINGLPIDLSHYGESSVPTKNVLSKFKTSYRSIYKYIDGSESNTESPSELHDIGEQVIRWVINGEPFLTPDVKSRLISAASEFYPNTEWYAKRLNAIDYYIQGDILEAYKSEEEALKLAEKEKAADWIVKNILIDLLNLQNTCINHQIKFEYEDYQERLSNSNININVPALDRYLQNTYEALLKEEIKRSTAAVGTTFFGNGFDGIVSNAVNCIFTSLLYGSYTHLINMREVLATIFYRTGKLYDDQDLLFASVKMYLFSGKHKDYIRLSNLEWNSISNLMIVNANELWHQALALQETVKDIVCIGLLHRTALYLNDSSFDEAEKYLEALSSKLSRSISPYYIDCLFTIYKRFNQGKMLKIIINIIKSEKYTTTTNLTHLIEAIDITSISDEVLNDFCEVLKNNMHKLITNNGDPQFIAALVNERPDIFSVLETLPDNGLVGEQKLIYDLNTDKANWNEILSTEIENAKQQFEANNSSSGFSLFASNPYSFISLLFDYDPSPEAIKIISENFFPLCIDVLNSACDVNTKDQCAESLCIALGYYRNHSIDIPPSVIECIEKASSTKTSEFTMTVRSSEGLWCRLIMLKILARVLDKNELIQWCISYSKKDNKERRALVECIKTYLQYVGSETDSLIISIVFQCCEDSDVCIRMTACECLWYILDTQFAEQAKEKIDEMAIDSAPAIKSKLLNICEKNRLKYTALTNKIALSLVHDAHYIIRNQAKRILEAELETC